MIWLGHEEICLCEPCRQKHKSCVREGSGQIPTSLPFFLPLQCVLDAMIYLERIRGLSDSLVEEADKVVGAIREYHIPLYVEK